ncbi:MAG: nucleotidyltransferase domain-containing protein [bacterium]
MPDKTIIDKIIKSILKVLVPDKIILFGSQARGDARPDSDYDILIIASKIDDELKTERLIYRALLDFNDPVGVDIIVKTPASAEKSRNMIVSVVKEAFKEGIVIYG